MPDIRIVLEAEDNLTPALKDSLKEIQSLDAQIVKLDKRIDELKADKKSIISGTIESDIASVRKLQNELRKLQAEKAKATATSGRSKADINADISRKKIEIEREYTHALNKNKQALKQVKLQRLAAATATNKLTGAEMKHTKEVKKSTAARNSMTNTLVRHIRQLESAVVAYYAVNQLMKTTVGFGIQLNRQYEDQKTGLAALLAAKTSDITTTGRQVDATEKFAIAQKQTANVLDEIKIAATETPASFAQMTGFFQQAIGHALAAGDAFGESIAGINTNVIQLTKRMSNLGAGIGMDMALVNEEIRSLMSGNVSRDSILSLILFGDPASANEAIKEAKNRTNGLTDLLEKALAPFSALEGIDTYTKLLAQLGAAYEDIARESTAGIFESIKVKIKDVTTFLKDNKVAIINFFAGVERYYRTMLPIFKQFASDISSSVGAAITVINNLLSVFKTEKEENTVKTVIRGWSLLFKVVGEFATNGSLLIKNAFISIESIVKTSVERASSAVNSILIGAHSARVRFLQFLDDKVFDSPKFTGQIKHFKGEVEKLTKTNDELAESIKNNTDAAQDEVDANRAKIKTFDEVLDATMAVNDAINETITKTKEQIDLDEELRQKGQDKINALKLVASTLKDANIYYDKHRDQVDKVKEEYEALLKAMKLLGSNSDVVAKITEYFQSLKKDALESSEDYKITKNFQEDYLKATLSTYEYDMAMLEKEKEEYLKHNIDKLKIDEWYQGRKKQIFEKATKEEKTYLKDIKNAAMQVFKNLEDYLVDWAMTGKFVFKDFAQAVIEDLLRITIQMNVIRPLTGIATDFLGGAATGAAISSTGHVLPYAHGGVVNNYISSVSSSAVKKYASGGVVTAPTFFPMAEGAGLMGEAGAEAILPLTRIDGDLGVKAKASNVIINVNNESGLPMELEELSRQQDNEGNTIITTVLHHLNYDPDFRSAIRGA